MTIDLNFLHFLVTVIVLLFLIVSHTVKYYRQREKFDEAFSRPWGLIGFVNKDGRYISRVPNKRRDNK